MTYREQLREFNKQKEFDLLDLIVADELECSIQDDMTDNDFNRVCGFISGIYLKDSSSNGVNIHARAVLNYLEDHTVEELLKLGRYEFLGMEELYND